MSKMSHFEFLIGRDRKTREKIERYISDLQHVAHLLDTNIKIEEMRTGVVDPARPDYPAAALRLKARRDNLVATISELEKTLTVRKTRSARLVH